MSVWDELPAVDSLDGFEARRDRCGYRILQDQFECEHSCFGWRVVNGEAVSYLATARPKMAPDSFDTATATLGDPPPDRGWFEVDWAPSVRLLNHVREQLPDWVEQIADLLSNLPSFFRVRIAKLDTNGA